MIHHDSGAAPISDFAFHRITSVTFYYHNAAYPQCQIECAEWSQCSLTLKHVVYVIACGVSVKLTYRAVCSDHRLRVGSGPD